MLLLYTCISVCSVKSVSYGSVMTNSDHCVTLHHTNYPLRDTNNSRMNSQMFNYATYIQVINFEPLNDVSRVRHTCVCVCTGIIWRREVPTTRAGSDCGHTHCRAAQTSWRGCTGVHCSCIILSLEAVLSLCIYRSCSITMSKCKGKSYLRLGFSFRVCICIYT